ncbi:MAG: oligopeptide/dipeptide ABC transporter ATP-binding protein, partial [Devosia sp.]
VSALDVSVQAQVLNLIADIRAARGLTLIFVSHDLSVVRHLSDRIAVMYLGRIVEIGPADDVFSAPVHPYAQALMAAIPPEEPGEQRARTLLSGDIPAPTRLPSGCAFHTRCPLAVERCRIDRPALRPLGDGRSAACHFAQPAPNARTQPAIPA